MEQNVAEIKKRWVRCTPFAIAVICFFLPFAQISCHGERDITALSATGFQMAVGIEFDSVKNSEKRNYQEPVLLLVLFCAAIGAALCFIKGQRGKLWPALVGAIGAVCMLIAKLRLDAYILKEGGGLLTLGWLTLEYKPGFILTSVLLLAGATVCGYQFSVARGEVADRITR